MTEPRKQINLHKLIGRTEYGDYEAVDYVFYHEHPSGKRFAGATGTGLRVVTKAEYDERMDEDNFADYLIECGLYSDAPEWLDDELLEEQAKKDARAELMNSGDEAVFDYSGYEHHDEVLRRERKRFMADHPDLINPDDYTFQELWGSNGLRRTHSDEAFADHHPEWPETCECTGGGRMFGSPYRGDRFVEVYSVSALKEICKAERIPTIRELIGG